MTEPSRQSNGRLLGQLRAQAAAARAHEQLMLQGWNESASWSQPEDREWIEGAYREARLAAREAEDRLEQGRAIARKVGVDV